MNNKKIIRSILAIVIGLVAGMSANMGIVTISPMIIAPPENVDVTTAEGLQSSIHLFQPKHFIMPFLAHALGTFVGALVSMKIAQCHEKSIALFFGIFFLLGGISAVAMIPAPTWFNAIDLTFAYIPMSLLAWYFNGKK
jgi:uncharacterized membrane protein HdeD (DUF308 family)